jgi:arsenite/tail-anchored protein-transporting ATPase
VERPTHARFTENICEGTIEPFTGGPEYVGFRTQTSSMATVVAEDYTSDEEGEYLDPSLQNIIDCESLKWIFVGGKGGVGKTTTSSSLAVVLSRYRKKVLIVSTDPAHNVSDAFSQKFSSEPVLVTGFDNLFAMEIDPKMPQDALFDGNAGVDGLDGDAGGLQSLMKDLTQAVPGIDEAMSFAELMKQVQTMDYDVIIFDTAPTGHTLRLLSFPTVMENAFGKIMALKDKFSGMFGQMAGMFGGANAPSQEMMLGKLEQTRAIIEKVNVQFQDPLKTTFVCVCIPEFLSVYETERLVQELAKFGIDVHNIVVNQVLIPPSSWSPDTSSWADNKITARQKMQNKYLEQVYDLYEDFHIVTMPLLDHEVRGVDRLKDFCEHLITPFVPE